MGSTRNVVLLSLLASAVSATNCAALTSCTACTSNSNCYLASSGCKNVLISKAAECGTFGLICNPYNCPATPPFAYNDVAAKNVFWRLQGAGKVATTSSEFTACGQNADPNIQFAGRVNVSCGYPFKTDFCTSDVYVVPSLQKVVVVSMGSIGTSQLIQVGLSLLSPCSVFSGQVVKYFDDAQESLWNGGLKNLVKSTLDANPTYGFVATGHSLGGAASYFFGAFVGQNGWRSAADIETYTFGAPRVGNADFYAQLAQYNPRVYRVVNDNDLITTLPLKASTQHPKFAVRYTPAMTGAASDPYTVCTTPEAAACTGDSLAISLGQHNEYFGADLDGWAANACLY